MFACLASYATEPKARGVKVSQMPQLGRGISVPAHANKTMCAISAGQMDPCVLVNFKGIEFRVAYCSEKHGNHVTDIHTTDSRFRTRQGLKIGDIITISAESEIMPVPYFEIYQAGSEDWLPVIGILDQVSMVRDGQSDVMVPLSYLNFDAGKPVRVRILGFKRQNDG